MGLDSLLPIRISAMRYLPIENSLFIENRQRLVEKLKPGSLAVFNSSDIQPTSADGTHPFIQQTDLFYLSGIDQAESTLVIAPDAKDVKHREILFLKETNEQLQAFTGKAYGTRLNPNWLLAQFGLGD